MIDTRITVDGKEVGAYDQRTIEQRVTKNEQALQARADWNQNDSTAVDYVKNRTHYKESTYTDYVLNSSDMGSVITGFSMPEVGETITVKINGVESVETVKEATSDNMGISYKYIGNIDFDSLHTGGTGWIVAGVGGEVSGFANPDTTITVKTIIVHKINNEFINFDGFVRTFDYHFKDYTIYKTLYDDDGSECLLYKAGNNSDIILPEPDSKLFGFMGEIGFSSVGSMGTNSCFVTGFTISSADGSLHVRHVVLGTDTTEMERIAAGYGYTLTKNPNA